MLYGRRRSELAIRNLSDQHTSHEPAGPRRGPGGAQAQAGPRRGEAAALLLAAARSRGRSWWMVDLAARLLPARQGIRGTVSVYGPRPRRVIRGALLCSGLDGARTRGIG